jgi:hypothetical protein
MKGHNTQGVPCGCDEPSCVRAVERGDTWVTEYCSIGPDGRTYFHHVDKQDGKTK